MGILAGMLGIGGGLIIVPALVYLLTEHLNLGLDIAMPMAIATSLSTIIFTGWSSSRAHYKLGNLKFDIVSWCALGIAFGAIIGAQVATSIPADLLKSIFAYLVLLIAAQMVFGSKRESDRQMTPIVLTLIGFVTGTVSSFMGIGGGALMVPILILFSVNIKQAIGCASFCGLVIAIFGSVSFIQAGWQLPGLPEYSIGYVYLPACAGIVITSVFTARIGAKISHHLNTQMLKKIFAGFLVVVSLRMLLG